MGKVVCIVQARMGSTRLPGKVHLPIFGKPMLARELLRLKQAEKVDAVVLATSTKPEDAAVEAIAQSVGVTCFRGSEKDVLDRYYHAAKNVEAETVVRVTGDCPLHDPAVVDEVVQRFFETDADYVKQPENYPEGTDTEVFPLAALETAWKEAALPSEREHVTLFIRNHPERFRLHEWRNGDFNYASMHWSVDTAADFKFVTKVYEHFGESKFHMNDVLALLQKRPELLDINKGGTGFEGLEKSLKEDSEWRKKHEK